MLSEFRYQNVCLRGAMLYLYKIAYHQYMAS